ncbi:hypothetical protein [Pararhizobium haloflavum]|uniref:hypothetical protein n=1 Tax=Pararhizobium haloflavum TaxID=2037914 RepID=UPI000C1A5E2E|nr:hypothetical protein [Pararhizobium haloflavum]
MRRGIAIALIAAAAFAGPGAARAANGYPTEVIADYVLGCMAANGQNAESLRRCSCSIDVVSSLLTYDDYAEAETVLRMRQVHGGGEKMMVFRETPAAQTKVDRLRQSQVEAEVRCFY